MSRAAETERFRLAVEAGSDITQALAGADAPTVIVRRVAEALDAWECDLYEYDPQSPHAHRGGALGARADG